MALALQKVFDILEGRWIPGLRAAVFVVAAAQALLPLGLIVYIARNANPKGDGMEWVAVAPALFIAGFFAAPALILSRMNRLLIVAALLAIAGALVSYAFYAEITRELSGAG
jgi:uncharacterized membrane protein